MSANQGAGRRTQWTRNDELSQEPHTFLVALQLLNHQCYLMGKGYRRTELLIGDHKQSLELVTFDRFHAQMLELVMVLLMILGAEGHMDEDSWPL